jgi:hypothetical protein
MNLSESVKFFGAYGTLPPTRDKTLVQRKMFFLGAVALVALSLSGCASAKRVRALEAKTTWMRIEARQAADRAYAMSRMTPAEAESIRLGARDAAAIKALSDTELRVARSGYASCQVDFKDLKEYVEDLQSQAAALLTANATLRSKLDSMTSTAGRIDGWWRKSQDETTYYKNESEDCAKKLSAHGHK